MIVLSTGDRLFLYSDAVPETANAKGQMFGNDQLLRTSTACESTPSPRASPRSVPTSNPGAKAWACSTT